jgi:hypothetical protein
MLGKLTCPTSIILKVPDKLTEVDNNAGKGDLPSNHDPQDPRQKLTYM